MFWIIIISVISEVFIFALLGWFIFRVIKVLKSPPLAVSK